MQSTGSLPATRISLTPLAPAALGLIALALAVAWPAESRAFPESWNLGLRTPIDALQRWLINSRAGDHPIFVFGFEPFSAAVDWGLRRAEALLLAVPWPTGLALAGALGWRLGGWRLATLATVSLLVMGLLGLWAASIQTLSLMLVATALTVAVGIPLGIAAALSDRFHRALQPVLDTLQTMPTFVYLIPVVLLFGIARVPAVVATLLYALAPIVRLTDLGIRGVQPAAIEAARAFGSTRAQLLWKVQLPLALPAIMAGINQTIMMAMSMVVIAALIGAGGLGREVLQAMQRVQVGAAFEAGLAIVLLAITLDRMSARLAIERGSWTADRRRAWDLAGLALIALAAWALGATTFPESWRVPVRDPVDAAVAWMRDTLFEFPLGPWVLGTGPLSDWLTLSVLNPFRDVLTDVLPWPSIVLLFAAAAWAAAGWRPAALTALLVTAIGLLGMWTLAMDTLSQVVVTLLLTAAIAIPLGVWMSQSDRTRSAITPVLDFLQTVPSFVLLVPVIMLFNVGRVPGIIAAVLYAVAPGARLTDLGVRGVPAETLEAARAFGSTQGQTLTKVQLPLALPAILAGVNQMVMMVLAMVIIAGLVGGAGLGLEVITGVSRNQPGRAAEAGLAIVLLAIVLDRLSQALARRPGANGATGGSV